MTKRQPARLYPRLSAARERKEKQLALLLDPAKTDRLRLADTLQLAGESAVDYLFIGGSFLTSNTLDNLLDDLRSNCSIPLVLFPGNSLQISSQADAVLLLSMISGRNPDLLIGQHVLAAPLLKAAGLEIVPCGYMLVDGGQHSAVQYISGTSPIPADQHDIAACTALAGELLGLKCIYLEAGSGAKNPVPPGLIRRVSETVSVPLIVGGGIRNGKQAAAAWQAGADLVVVGNAVEKKPGLIRELSGSRQGL